MTCVLAEEAADVVVCCGSLSGSVLSAASSSGVDVFVLKLYSHLFYDSCKYELDSSSSNFKDFKWAYSLYNAYL